MSTCRSSSRPTSRRGSGDSSSSAASTNRTCATGSWRRPPTPSAEPPVTSCCPTIGARRGPRRGRRPAVGESPRPWNDNLVAGQHSRRPERGAVVAPRDDWAPRGARLVAKIAHALRDVAAVTEVEHVGSTSVPHLIAKDVLDIQVGVRDLAVADDPGFRAAMRGAGLLRFDHLDADTPHPSGADPDGWRKRVFGSTDPGEIAHVHVREAGSPAWRFALLFRDWLSHVAGRARGLRRREAPTPRPPRHDDGLRRRPRSRGSTRPSRALRAGRPRPDWDPTLRSRPRGREVSGIRNCCGRRAW